MYDMVVRKPNECAIQKKTETLLRAAKNPTSTREVYFIIWTSIGWGWAKGRVRRVFETKHGKGFKIEGSDRVFSQRDLYLTQSAVEKVLSEIWGL